ncbi:protein DpdH [Geitlerinema sp. PCC 7407]|uniref:protein DpdH n=1 Tax=Geitlerinema sp. PCC 7407 TaxID=1173025 RepID=UPI00029FA1D5|nr:protein DpdH [Geitlerinema sp. PCC 7407]AFY67279.1 hypothetical protein GEI7407_2806 [Geitlerinema sp. PCC 7407]
MTFSKYVCWHPDMVRKVMDVEATQPEDHIFLATHHPIKMYRQPLTEAQSKVPYDEEKFLKDFLETPDFAFVPVLGTSGTGKSHLIRWLNTRIRSIRQEPHYRVLLIPKVGTNLRDIIERILTGLEGSEFDEYRNRLRQATNTLSEAEAREQLLANLAIAVGPSGKHDRNRLSFTQNGLIDSLPALLFDPYFREHWLREEGIIHKLIIHVLGHRDSVEIVEERRQFSVEDLPRDIRDIDKASAAARSFYALLVGDDEVQQASVDWLNEHLDEAVAKVLNLGREDLQQLMLDVRRALARQGVELILLIEDFAKLQGIDREVLEAVLARPQQIEGVALCPMRTALACTTGYFQGLIDTVRTRTDFSVNLDIEAVGDQSLVTQADVQQLAVRYLNAVRLGNQEIQTWMEDAEEETGEPRNPIPSACMDCDYRTPCHNGFGQVDGMGLYPFSAKAIERMRDRANPGVFNPRILIKDVLRYTLEYHGSDLKLGRFPSPLLLDHFRGSTLSAMLIREIESRDTAENARRREALLNLWTDGNKLHDLAPEIHTAFDLPALGIQQQEISTPISLPTTSTATRAKETTATSTNVAKLPILDQTDSVTLPTGLEEQLQALDQWRNGTQLPQNVADDLRRRLFPAIEAMIDWDAELLLRNQFSDKLFKQRNINFRNAATSSQVRDVELLLPLVPDDLGDTAIALQAILLYNHYKHWKFPDGSTFFRIYARKLEEWSNFVLNEIPKCTTRTRQAWDPVPAVVELLAIAGRMAGRPTDNLEDRINAVFTDLEKVEISSRANYWQKLFNTLKKNQPKLQEILQARIPCTKGGRAVLQMIDAAQLVSPLKAVADEWKPQVDVSDSSTDQPFKAIGDTRRAIDELLEQAVREERDRQLNVYQQLINELGEDFSQKEVVASLTKTIDQVRGAGIPGISNRDALMEAMKNFENARLKGYLDLMKKIQNTEEIGLLFQYLSSASERPVEIISRFLNLARQAVDKSTESTQKSLADLRSTGAGDLEASYIGIERSLLELQQLAHEIKGESPCS